MHPRRNYTGGALGAPVLSAPGAAAAAMIGRVTEVGRRTEREVTWEEMTWDRVICYTKNIFGEMIPNAGFEDQAPGK
jgi:hypothetical protein